MDCLFSSQIGPPERLRLEAVLPWFFRCSDGCKSIQILGAGNINDTYLVEFVSRPPAVLQRINSVVFPEPSLVAGNFSIISRHIEAKKRQAGSDAVFPRAIPEITGNPYHQDEAGAVWRAMAYIENTESHRFVKDKVQAFAGGKMLGRFHLLLDDLDPQTLAQPIPGFHDLPGYCLAYRRVSSCHQRRHSDELISCCQAIDRRLQDAGILERSRQQRLISRRVIHADPKCDNVLFDKQTGEAVALIDLDTVSSGLLHYDLGDCLRSFCNPVGEKPDTLSDVYFDTEMCRQVLAGYRSSGAPLSGAERALIYQGVRLLTFELGLRFLTDYLAGDRYFKASHERENLERTMVQIRLLESIENQQTAIESIVASLG